MPLPDLTPAVLKPYLEDCGYSGSRLAEKYRFSDRVAALAGFFDKPWDARSACLAVVEANGDSQAAAQACLPLGAPTAFVCAGDTLDWYKLTPEGPTKPRRIPAIRIKEFFKKHGEELSPDVIYFAKTRRPTAKARQLWFVDVGLMPSVERRAGGDLRRLVETAIQNLMVALKGRLKTRKDYTDLYKTVFWLLAAKLLHEKRVKNFRRIDLTDVEDVFKRVARHYAAVDDLPPGDRFWRPAINDTAQDIAAWGHLGNISTETLAYLYETALIDKKPKGAAAKKLGKGANVRKELGIHSTPPVLVDHMLSQLWTLIEQIEPNDRRVFEPACGHGGFLVAALRWLREFSGLTEGSERHRYLSERLFGIEVDPFARELAKLSLTLADVPHGNSWRVEQKDMFEPGILQKASRNCTILLANPPYEPFTPKEEKCYTKLGQPVTTITKAAEMLTRTLQHLPSGAVFGIVVPQGMLHDKESTSIREFLANKCDVTEISLFADKLFAQADHETAILLGRRKKPANGRGSLWYRRVREEGMEGFKDRMAFSLERRVPQSRFAKETGWNMLVPDLEDVWDYLRGTSQLIQEVHVQKGFEFLGERELNGREVESPTRRPGWRRAFVRVDDYEISGLPRQVWIDYSPENMRRPGNFEKPGVPQIIMNYAPVARAPWRLKAGVDTKGLLASSRFVVFRPRTQSLPLDLLWAILNSPIANAYAYCYSGKRETLVREWRSFPLPTIVPENRRAIELAVERYLEAVQPPDEFKLGEPNNAPIREALLALDAEVLRLYDLPSRLERQLLDLFQGVERKGVGCRFPGYFPTDFKPCIPLHEYISDAYRRSTAGEIVKRLRPVRSDAAIAALDAVDSIADGE